MYTWDEIREQVRFVESGIWTAALELGIEIQFSYRSAARSPELIVQLYFDREPSRDHTFSVEEDDGIAWRTCFGYATVVQTVA